MIKHVVIFKLNDEANGKSKSENAAILKEKLLELKNLIPEILEIKVASKLDEAPESHFDIFLSVTFNNNDELNIYRNHPKHKEVVEFIKTVTKDISAIDYSV